MSKAVDAWCRHSDEARTRSLAVWATKQLRKCERSASESSGHSGEAAEEETEVKKARMGGEIFYRCVDV